MFWTDQKSSTIELKKKNLFIAEFVGTTNFNWDGASSESEKNIKFLIKKFSLPSITIPFERLHGNQYVHYYHVGEVNWEPITITFVDVISKNTNIPNWKNLFFNYLNKNLITLQNRTGMLDLATFCSFIKVSNLNTLLDDTENEVLNTFNTFDVQTDPNDQNKTILANKQTYDNRNQIREEFYIYKPKITKIDFGSLDYGSDDANEVSITFLPEWCDTKEDPTKDT